MALSWLKRRESLPSKLKTEICMQQARPKSVFDKNQAACRRIMNHPLPTLGVHKPLRQGLGLCGYVIVGLLIWGSAGRASQSSPISAKAARGLSYHHEEIPDGPWSTHIVTVERANRNFEIHSSLARGRHLDWRRSAIKSERCRQKSDGPWQD